MDDPSVLAFFKGGPLDGRAEVIEEPMARWLIPVLEDPSGKQSYFRYDRAPSMKPDECVYVYQGVSDGTT